MAKGINDKTIVPVYNNTTGSVSYYSELNRVSRRWDKPDTERKISVEELKDLISYNGGLKLLEQCLLIKDIDVRIELGMSVEKEQLLDNAGIKELLKKSVSEIEDVLKDANKNIKDKIVQFAIESKINEIDKLEVIQQHTGFNVLNAINEKKQEEKENKEKAK